MDVDILGSLTEGPRDNVEKRKVDGMNLDLDDILYGASASQTQNPPRKQSSQAEDQGDSEDDAAFIALQQAAQFRKASSIKSSVSVKKGGGFQAMGLQPTLLKAIAKKGFSVPTPIQRKTIPLILERKDIVAMARTGSGKTAAFVLPMIQKLKSHSPRVGARALIMSPSRELAIQTLKVVKDFCRGTDLKTALLVGGDSLEEQFAAMATNPDILIATPGRFLHLKVEMSLPLSSIQYVVFDEADRLFEMGFAAQLTEILHALPPNRQTLLFSATLPSSLVEFARAGLQEPALIRLDAETKIPPDLQSAFFSIKAGEKEGALLHLLHDVIKVPIGPPDGIPDSVRDDDYDESDGDGKKRGTKKMTHAKKKLLHAASGKGNPTEFSTIIFTATKHRVEYLSQLLIHAGFAVSFVYGSLDQEARRIQVHRFRAGRTHLLVVTDVAARGIDIPVLRNVINYDFPSQSKIFVHRVGRTARAGQQGWAYSLVQDIDAAYLIDLQLFLGRQLVVGQGADEKEASTNSDIVLGSLSRDQVSPHVEWAGRALAESFDLRSIRQVAEKAERLYLKSRNHPALQSIQRAKSLVASEAWSQLNLCFGVEDRPEQQALADMLARISRFRPPETIFEVNRGGKATSIVAADIMRDVRKKVTPRRNKDQQDDVEDGDEDDAEDDAEDAVDGDEDEMDVDEAPSGYHSSDSEDDLEVIISDPQNKAEKSRKKDQPKTAFYDPEVFMSYTPRNRNEAEERGYGVHSGSSSSNTALFAEAARDATLDLGHDEASRSFGEATRASAMTRGMRWDKKARKYVARANDEDGSRASGSKMIRGESGVKIAASFQSGRFDRWKRAHRIQAMPRVGELESSSAATSARNATIDANPDKKGGSKSGPGHRFRHNKVTAPREADKYRDDFAVRKKRVDEARAQRVGRFRDGDGSKREIHGADHIVKARKEKQKRLEKNARPSKKPKTKRK